MPDFTWKPVFVFLWIQHTSFPHLFVILESWIAQLCLCLWAGVNVHRHADCFHVNPFCVAFGVYSTRTCWFLPLTCTQLNFNPLLLLKHHTTCSVKCTSVTSGLLWSQLSEWQSQNALSLQGWAENEGAFVFLRYIFTCVCHSFCLLSSRE